VSKKQTPESFWKRVRKGSTKNCWPWLGSCTSGGYGDLSWHGHVVQAHRVAYWLTHGGIELLTGFREGTAATGSEFVLHRCDNRSCCNPDHLFLGTMQVNNLDAYAKGRNKQPQGAAHANAKLTSEEAMLIRSKYASGQYTQEALAAGYGVSQRVVSLIVRGESYR